MNTASEPLDQEFRIVAPDGCVRWPRTAGHIAEDQTSGQFPDVEVAELSGTVVHELRQPMASILLNARAAVQMLDATADAVDIPELRAILEEIISADQRASRLITGARDLLRATPLAVEPVAVSDLIDDVLGITRADIASHQVKLERQIDAEAPPVLGDRTQLQQVLVNLIVNACEAMDGRPPAERRLVIRAVGAFGGYSHLAVCDTGPGITVSPADRVFEPFVTAKPDGLGLGLAICRRIVTAHGGTIWAENNEPRGASFHFNIPGASVRRAAELKSGATPLVPRQSKLSGKATAARAASQKIREETRAIVMQILSGRQGRVTA